MPEALVPNQERAVTTRGKNLIVVAGAGTGKTRVLVERYMRLLETAALPSIVAITFTEKAAREMRQRVREAITDRANTETNDRALWEKHLREIDSARISTIHSLCAALLRSNPVEAGVDPRFEVLEEADAQIWHEEALDEALTELTEKGGPALALFYEYEIRDVRGALEALLARGNSAGQAFARVPDTADALLGDWQKRLDKAQREALETLSTSVRWQALVDWLNDHRATNATDTIEKVRAEAVRAAGEISIARFDESLQGLRSIGDLKLTGGSKKNWDDFDAVKGNLRLLRDLARSYLKSFDLTVAADDRRSADLVLLWKELWLKAQARYAQRKEAKRVLDFDSLESRAQKLLLGDPEVVARYRSEFSSLLVDEFQDTNDTQRDLIYALASPEEPDRLFIVGDGKQSIYGFRDADVSVFSEARKDIVKWGGEDACILLDQSFRAHTRLVDCFNQLFESIFAVEGERKPFEISYESMRSERASPPGEAVVETVELDASEEELSTDELREWEGRELALRISRLVRERFPVWERQGETYRDASFGDIALLFRVGTSMPIYEEALKDAEIPYITLGGKGYYDRPEVRDLVQLLRAVDNPFDDLALATVLHSPLYTLSGETLYRLRRDGKHLREAMGTPPDDIPGAERERVQYALDSLEELWERSGRVTILDLLKEALEATGYLATVASLADGKRRRANVEKLLALARRTGLVQLSEFNAHLQELYAQEVREGEALVETGDAVQLMTIHRAKGLEFPIVIIPDAGRAPYGPPELVLADRGAGIAVKVHEANGDWFKPVPFRLMEMEAARRDDAEEKRLLYVAMTRAQDHVIVSGGAKMHAKSYLAQIKAASSISKPPGVQVSATLTASSPGPGDVKFHTEPYPAPSLKAFEHVPPPPLPVLVHPLPMPRVSELHMFTPTGLQSLVSNPAEFERRHLEGAPERIPDVTRRTKSAHAPAYVVGEIAHRAIQHWRFPHASARLDALLEGYARELGMTDKRELRDAVRDATRILEKFEQSELCRQMQRARVRRHEVPFVFEWEGRTVHGTLDALVEPADGKWFVVDFKTDRIVPEPADILERYGVQLALYGQAAQALLGVTPLVRVHYIRANQTLDFAEQDLAGALVRVRRAMEV